MYHRNNVVESTHSTRAQKLHLPANSPVKIVLLCFLFASLFVTRGWTQPSISGRVINDQTGFGVVGIDLDVFDETGASVAVSGALSGIDGAFTISLPAAGTYTLRADPSRTDLFADVFYDHVFLKSQATPIVVGASDAISGIELRLQIGYEIRGQVLTGGTPLADVDLDVFAESGEFLSGYPAISATDGTFAIGALPSGAYFVRADPDPALGQLQVAKFYGGVFTLEGATPIVIAGQSVDGINIDLDVPGGVIGGRITSKATGAGVAEMDLDLYDSTGQRQAYNAKSDVDGNYLLGPVPPGSYILRADPTIAQGLQRTYYPDTPFSGEAVLIDVTADAVTSNIDFSLSEAGSINGVLLDAESGAGVEAIDLDVFDGAGRRLDVSAKTDSQGNFQLGPLPLGEFFVRADPQIAQGYARTYYPGVFYLTDAQLVTVSSGPPSNLEWSLPSAGTITGVISDAGSSAGLPEIDLDVFDASGRRFEITTRSGIDGVFEVGPLPAGQYLLRADPTIAQAFSRTYYPNTPFFSEAVAIDVQANTATAGIDFSLTAAGSISGRIQDAAQGMAIADIDLDVFDTTGRRFDVTARSDVNGNYQLGPLPAGLVIVRADPKPTQGWLTQYYQNSVALSGAVPVTVTAGAPTADIDFSLTPAGWIEGFVFSESQAPLEGIDLDLFLATTGERVSGSGGTSADGGFIIGPLAPDNYVLRADPDIAQGYAVEYYNDQINKANADIITVSPSAGVTGIELVLATGGSISGRVTAGEPPQPVASMDMDVLTAGSLIRLDQSQKTDVDGFFTLGPLPAGDYIIRTDPTLDQPYTRTYYGQSTRAQDASTITLAAGEQKTGFDIQLLLKTPPTVALQSPAAGAQLFAPADILLSATAEDADGSVVKVEFYIDGALLGEALAAPYEYAWSSVPAGTYQVWATATDNHGLSASTDPLTVEVATPGSNDPPAIQIQSSGGGSLTLSFPTVAGQTYIIESKVDLNNPNWELVETRSGDGQDYVFSLPTSGETQRFYRIRMN